MLKIKVYGQEGEKLKKIIRRKYPDDFKIFKRKDKQKVDMIICYGGDGTLLMSEREHPGVPKVCIRNSQICNLCRDETRDTILKLLVKNKYNIARHHKIEAIFKDKRILALNDIIVGHFFINTALRFRVLIDDVPYGGEFLGDGVVVATAIGSTAYYQSITRSNFQEGIGVAFNNTVNSIGHILVNDNTKIKVLITRGPGRLRRDNDKFMLKLKKGDEVLIQKSKQVAKLIDFYSPYKKYNIDISKDRLPLGYCQVCRKYYR